MPTALLYTMNANEEQLEQLMSAPLDIDFRYLDQCFHMQPEVVNSCNTFQYNDNENYAEGFRAYAAAKWQHHEEQFEKDLCNARDAGRRMVEKIKETGSCIL